MHSQAVTDLESEMKLLRWHKLANESALKAAILKNKALRRNEKEILRLPFNSHAHSQFTDAMREERSKERMTDESFVRRSIYQEAELDSNGRSKKIYRTTESIGLDTQKNLQVINENPYRKFT